MLFCRKFEFLSCVLAVFALVMFAQNAFALDSFPVPNELEKGYTLVSVEEQGDNTITKYEVTDVIKYFDKTTGEEVAPEDKLPEVEYKEVAVKELTPKYYKLELSKTEYGDKENHNDSSVKYFKWSSSDYGNIFQNGTAEDKDITFYINNTRQTASSILSNPTGSIESNFVNLKNYPSGGKNSVNAFGGAIYNSGQNAEITSITGDFVGNHALASTYMSYGSSTSYTINNYAKGGAIYNESGKIGTIKGDFVANIAESTISSGSAYGSFKAYSQGGAIYNKDGEIGDIYGNFIGNSATGAANALYTDGGAIYNEKGKIGSIKGDFIGNTATYRSGGGTFKYSNGGAIYNKEGNITSIDGNFVGNYASSSINSLGGAIFNQNAVIGDINGDFIGNYAYAITFNTSTKMYTNGGAIYNENSSIAAINGDFIGNYAYAETAESAYAYGGALYNKKGTIGDIKGSFIGNSTFAAADTSSAYGGAVNNENGEIKSITGDFFDNNTSAGNYSFGGALYNSGKISSINGDFVGNNSYSHYDKENNSGYTYSNAEGGAIDNYGTISTIEGSFVKNQAVADNNAYGGAISNYNVIDNLKGDFVSNTATAENGKGGALSNQGTIKELQGTFFNNHVSATEKAYGGAIYNSGKIGESADDIKNGGIINSSFVNNYAEAQGDKAVALGGAILTESGKLNIVADNGISLFSGNYTETNGVKESNAIYMLGSAYDPEGVDYTAPELNLESKNNGIIQFDDKIAGGAYVQYGEYDEETWEYIDKSYYDESKKFAYSLNLKGDSTGKIIFNNEVENANITIEDTNVYLKEAAYFSKSPTLNVNSGTLNINHLGNETINFENFSFGGTINLNSVDVDLVNESMGRITADNYGDTSGVINVNGFNLLNSTTKNKTEILFADPQYANNVSYQGTNPIAYSPIYKYDVSYNPENGFFTFVQGSSSNPSENHNPSVLAPSVATQAGAYTTQLQTFNYAFQHADAFMNIPYLDRMAMKNRNKYALSPTGDATDVGTFSPLLTHDESAGFWFKPYASFESVPLKNGPKVSNINYGTLIGYDSQLRSISHGFDRVITGYIGYNGASQCYSGVDAYQNGGILGGTATFYKNNFFNATTISVGATAGDAKGMYGSENYTMLLAGIANKTGYNFEFFKGKMILQPSMLISYSFVNTFDYTNAAGLRIKSDPLNAIQLAPGLKLIGNTKNGWQPYIGVSMIWNLLDKTKVTADDVRLPEMSIKPYVQYGVGVQKRFGERITGYTQAMINSGGRNGVSLSAGFRWAVGKK